MKTPPVDDKTPDSPLLLYISSTLSIREISKQLNLNYATLNNRCAKEGWGKLRKNYTSKVMETSVKRQSGVLCKQIDSIQSAERNHYRQAIDQLEQARQALNPDDKQYIYQLKLYADARKQLQSIQYKSYGIAESAANNTGGNVIFNNYPAENIASRYRVIGRSEVTPPPEANDRGGYSPTLTASDVDVIEKVAFSPETAIIDVTPLDSTDDSAIRAEEECIPPVESSNKGEGAKPEQGQNEGVLVGKHRYEKISDF